MPYLYDPSQSINMMQSGLEQGLGQRTQFGYNVYAQKEKEWQQLKAEQKQFNQTIGQQFAKAGTLAQGGDPENPGVLGQGYFNTKAGGIFQKMRNDSLKKAFEEQQGNTAAGAIENAISSSMSHITGFGPGTPPPSATATAPAPATTAAPAVPDTTALLRAATANATQIQNNQVTAGPGVRSGSSTSAFTGLPTTPLGGSQQTVDPNASAFAGLPTTPSPTIGMQPTSTASAESSVRDASQHLQTMIKEHGADSPEAAEAREQLNNAIRNKENASDQDVLRNMNKSGSANTIYSHGDTSMHIIENPVTGLPEVMMKMGDEVFPVDQQTAEMIVGKLRENEALTDRMVKREMLFREYEQNIFNADLRRVASETMNRSKVDAFVAQLENPFLKRDLQLSDDEYESFKEIWKDAVAQIEPFLQHMTPGEVEAHLNDLMSMATDSQAIGAATDHAVRSYSQRLHNYNRNKVSKLTDLLRDSDSTINDLTRDLESYNEEVDSLELEYEEAYAQHKEDEDLYDPPSRTALDKAIEKRDKANELLQKENHNKSLLIQREKRASASLNGVYDYRYGQQNIYGTRIEPASPSYHIARSVLLGSFYDPKTGDIDVDALNKMPSNELENVLRAMHNHAISASSGWTDSGLFDETAANYWAQALQLVGLEPQRLSEMILELQQQQQQQQPPQTNPSATTGGTTSGATSGAGGGGAQSGPITFPSSTVVTPQQPTQLPDIQTAVQNITSGGISLVGLGTRKDGSEIEDELSVTDSDIENARGRTDLSEDEAVNIMKSYFDRILKHLLSQGYAMEDAQQIASMAVKEQGFDNETLSKDRFEQLTKEEYEAMGVKEREKWMGGYVGRIEYYNPEKEEWVGYKPKGWTHARTTGKKKWQ